MKTIYLFVKKCKKIMVFIISKSMQYIYIFDIKIELLFIRF